MNIEYGFITENMPEKEIVRVLNAKLKIFFTEIADKEFDIYKSNKLRKMENNRGVSYNPEKIPWDYDYSYYFLHKYYGISLELYPNTNNKGESKFKNPGVMWNLLVIERDFYVKGKTGVVNKSNPDIKHFMEYFLQDLPFEVVVVYEYEKDEERV